MKNGLDEEYLGLLKDILENGVEKDTRNGKTLSVFGRQIRYKFKDGKFPLLTTKKMYWKGIVTELLWFLRGDTNIKYLVNNDCHIWDGDCYKKYCEVAGAVEEPDYIIHVDDPNQNCTRLMTKEEFINKIKTDDEFAKKWGDLGKIYGHSWRNWNDGIDQISDLIKQLKENPDSRRLLISAWNASDLPHQVLPPCHYGFQVWTRELSHDERFELYKKVCGRDLQPHITGINFKQFHFDEFNVPTRAISLMWSQRSVDMALGWPFNAASYGLLLELLGKMVNMIPDELICNLGDVHIYKNQIEGIKEQLTREPYQLPKLNINTEWWPTESGECGVGPIDAQAVLKGFSDDSFCRCLMEEDIQLSDYKHHPTIKMPLSN